MKQMTRLSMIVVPRLHSAISVYGFYIVISVTAVPVGDTGPVFLHSLADVPFVVIGLRLAFCGVADFLFYLVWEVSVLSFVFHNDCVLLINSRIRRKSKVIRRIIRKKLLHHSRLTVV